MATINPYLNFNGNAEEAFSFYSSVFGGELLDLMRWKDAPEADKIQEGEREKVMHVCLPIAEGNFLMGADILGSMGESFNAGNNFQILINAESREEADRLFKGLSAGGKVIMDMHEAFWGAYFGMFTDRFGIRWMVNSGCEENS